MTDVFCKAVKCQWNKWDANYKKHICSKAIIHLDRKAWCDLSELARPIKDTDQQVSDE